MLVKRLVTIEDLGNIDVLFTDKTGTLTEGAITFEAALDPAGTESLTPLLLGLVCNEATVTATGVAGGNALDRALLEAPEAGPLGDVADGPGAYARLGMLPFDHQRQLATVVARASDDRTVLITKGAPEAVLARCIDVPAGSTTVLEGLFGDGARVVAVATRETSGRAQPTAADEHDLQLAGFLSFSDRPKADAGASIATLNRLGITVRVITGDNGSSVPSGGPSGLGVLPEPCCIGRVASSCLGSGDAGSGPRCSLFEVLPSLGGCGVGRGVDGVVVIELVLAVAGRHLKDPGMPIAHDGFALNAAIGIATAIAWGSASEPSSSVTRRNPRVRWALGTG